MSGAAEAFVRHALSVRWDAMPEPAQAAVKTFLLDSLGVGIAGACAPYASDVRRLAMAWSGAGPAHAWGAGARGLSPAGAAFVNGFQIHCQEYDCVHEPAVVHPMAVVLAALMAECEGRASPANGRDLGAAIAAGVDIAAGLGVAAPGPLKFFRPANAGLFGATLALARLRGLGPGRALDAMGYALAFCSGTMQAHLEGKPALPLQIAAAARSAICAADLAEAGLSGPRDMLEGPFGYFSLFEDREDLAPVIAGLGRVWRIAQVSHKPFPTGRAAQGGIVLVQQLRAQGLTAGNLAALTLSAPPLIKRLVGRPAHDAMTPSYARLCFGYLGAGVIERGEVGLDDFTPERLGQASRLALAAKIEVTVSEVTDPAAFTPQTAIARLHDGTVLEARTDALYGSPAAPMSRDDHLAKFRACLAYGFGRPCDGLAEALIERVDDLENLEDAGALSRLAAGREDGA